MMSTQLQLQLDCGAQKIISLQPTNDPGATPRINKPTPTNQPTNQAPPSDRDWRCSNQPRPCGMPSRPSTRPCTRLVRDLVRDLVHGQLGATRHIPAKAMHVRMCVFCWFRMYRYEISKNTIVLTASPRPLPAPEPLPAPTLCRLRTQYKDKLDFGLHTYEFIWFFLGLGVCLFI